MVTTRPPKTIVKPTALGPVANTDTKLLIYSLFQQGRVLAQDAVEKAGWSNAEFWLRRQTTWAALGCIKGPSGAGKTEIPLKW